jgi:hypothetical protein
MPRTTQDKTEARGVGLKASEWVEVEKIARELDITPHAVLQYGIRYFMRDYRAGKIKKQAKKIHTLPDLE